MLPKCDLVEKRLLLFYFMGGVTKSNFYRSIGKNYPDDQVLSFIYLIGNFMWFLEKEEIKDIDKKPHHQEPHA